MPPSAVIDVVRSEKEFDQLEQEWSALHERSACSVFQSFEWLRTWWAHFGGGAYLYCLCIRENGSLIGIVPLCRQRVTLLGIPLYTRLCFIGVPQSDYLDMIAAPGSEEQVLAALAEHLAAHPGIWDVLDLEEMDSDVPMAVRLPEILPRVRIHPRVDRGPVCPIVALPDTFSEYLQNLGGNTRYAFTKKSKQLRERHRIDLQMIAEPSEAVHEGIETYIGIHERRWKGLGHPSVYDHAHHRQFLHTLAERFARRGWLRLFILRADDAAVAVSVEFNYHRRIYMYQSNAAGPDDVMRHSPGLLIKFSAIERGIQEGMKTYDLLRGDEPYKFDNLKAVPHYNRTIRAAYPSIGGSLRFKVFLLHLLLKKIFGRLALEGHEFARFRITKHPSVPAVAWYCISRGGVILRMGMRYLQTYFLSRAARSNDH